MIGKNFLLSCKNNGILYSFRFAVLKRLIKNSTVESDQFLSKNYRNIKVIKKTEDKVFNVMPTEDKLANKIYKKLIGKHNVKGQFLVEITDCYLLTQWSIPVTKEGYILVEPAGTIGMLVGNIIKSKDSGLLPEIRFLFFLILIRVSNYLRINLFNNVLNYPALFHMVPRHGFKPLEPGIGHWVFENLPQLKMYFEAILKKKDLM